MDLIALALFPCHQHLFHCRDTNFKLPAGAYSYRGIRLKKYPLTGFLTFFIVQGAVTFYTIYKGISYDENARPPLLPMLISSLLIGALYPLTQIYQHKQDKEDGVTSISYKLGYKGTFVFSGLLFTSASVIIFSILKITTFYIRFTYLHGVCSSCGTTFFTGQLRFLKIMRLQNFKSSL
jgi:1,4-dihydroxy-2-naphthoate octaprenyltransferase